MQYSKTSKSRITIYVKSSPKRFDLWDCVLPRHLPLNCFHKYKNLINFLWANPVLLPAGFRRGHSTSLFLKAYKARKYSQFIKSFEWHA